MINMRSAVFARQAVLGEHSAEIVYSKDRLRYPMRRKGPKGTYEFERISWDNAYDIIVENLNTIKEESGPEATAIYTGRGSFELAMCDVFQPKGVAVSSVTMGGMLVNMFSDIENAQMIVVWGANPATDCPPLDLDRIVSAQQQGAQVVVIDPRRIMSATLPNAEWIPIRPGTDGALALGMCNVLIEEELYDEDFVKNWSIGFDDLAGYVPGELLRQTVRLRLCIADLSTATVVCRQYGQRWFSGHLQDSLMCRVDAALPCARTIFL